jgi:hypothetical protein
MNRRWALVGLAGLVVFCGNAAAEWTLLGGTPAIYSAYADKASVKRTGTIVQMYGLYDFIMADVAVDGQPHESTVVLREYDCSAPRVRLLAYVDYAGHMGEGKVVSRPDDRPPARWEEVVPGSIDEAFIRMACGS